MYLTDASTMYKKNFLNFLSITFKVDLVNLFQYHPDKNPEDPEAAKQKFQVVVYYFEYIFFVIYQLIIHKYLTKKLFLYKNNIFL